MAAGSHLPFLGAGNHLLDEGRDAGYLHSLGLDFFSLQDSRGKTLQLSLEGLHMLACPGPVHCWCISLPNPVVLAQALADPLLSLVMSPAILTSQPLSRLCSWDVNCDNMYLSRG